MMDETAPSPDVSSDLVESARRTSSALRALSHEHRLMILGILARGERSVGELETLLQLPQPAVSQQLARLRLDHLVNCRRDGRTIYYSLATERVLSIRASLNSLLVSPDEIVSKEAQSFEEPAAAISGQLAAAV